MRKRVIGLGIAAVALVAVTGAESSCGTQTSGSGQAATAQTIAVTYEIDGRSASNITYTTDGAGSTEQQNDVKLPWTKTINVPSGFAIVSLSAQNGGGGSISCKITGPGGKVLKQAQSSGQYAIASCSGSIS